MKPNQQRGGFSHWRPNQLLAVAIDALGCEALIASTGLSWRRLSSWTKPEHRFTTEQKARVVLAILTLAEPHSDIFRAASTLRDRIRAELEYETGATRTSIESPTRGVWK